MKVRKHRQRMATLAISLAAVAPAHAQFDLLRTLIPQVQLVGDMYNGRQHGEKVGTILRLAGSGDRPQALRLAEELVAEDQKTQPDSLMSLRGNMLKQSVGIAANLQELSGNYARAIELQQILLAARGPLDRMPGMPGEFATRFKIGELQEKSGDAGAAKRTYQALLASPDSALPINSLYRIALFARLGRTALLAGDDALAETSLLRAIDEDPAIAGQPTGRAPGDGQNLFDVTATLRSAMTRVSELSATMAADHAILDANGELVSAGDATPGQRRGLLAVDGPLMDLAALYHRKHDAVALKSLYLGKFSDYAARTARVDSGAIGPSAQQEQEYARFGAYLAALRQDQLAEQAFGHALRLNAIRLKRAAVNVPPEMLAASFATRRQILDMVLSLRLADGADPARWRPALGELLQSKGLQSEFLARRTRAIGLAPDPEIRRLAAAMEAIDAAGTGDDYARHRNAAVALQARVGALLPPLVFEDGERFLAQVQQRAGTETLVSLFLFTRFDFASQQFGARHYLGAQVGRDGVKVADLGPSESLDALGMALRADLARRPASGAKLPVLQSARALYDAMLKPLLGGRAAKGAYVADLDGALALLPMEALADGGGRYLIEEGEWRYVSSARALLRSAPARTESTQAVVLADPAYDVQGPAAAPAVRRGAATPAMRFEPLPQALEEGKAVVAALSRSGNKVQFYSGPEASMQVLAALRAPRYLHIATHGFFVEEAGVRRQQGTGNDGRRYVAETYAAGMSSGLALAGANSTLAAGRGDGVIYAAQLRRLDLTDTELAVLSACDTSVGAVHPGEGVDSLRQALEVAGVRSMVTSLWPVPDLETRAVMTDFYDALGTGASKPGSLRQAKLRMKQRQAHPFYWASFVVTGMR